MLKNPIEKYKRIRCIKENVYGQIYEAIDETNQ